jgi:hypothetical protein
MIKVGIPKGSNRNVLLEDSEVMDFASNPPPQPEARRPERGA